MHDAAMHQVALSRVSAEFLDLAGEESVASMVRRALLQQPECLPALHEIAREQHIVPRTLIRRLKREGVSYQQILQQVRRQQAMELLADPGLTVKQISYLLGYKDPSNFGRAFRQWQGQSPGAYRRRLRRD
jgi:AraC-like DNA-binding protein